jgi:hypothetical protein
MHAHVGAGELALDKVERPALDQRTGKELADFSPQTKMENGGQNRTGQDATDIQRTNQLSGSAHLPNFAHHQ